MKTAITRINLILAQLKTQAETLDQINKHSKSHRIIQENDLFSEALFSTHSDLYIPYINEVEQKTSELDRLLNANKHQLAHSRLQQIEQQISALFNAINSHESLHKEPEQRLNAIKSRRYKKAAKALMNSSHQLHKKLSETFEFERRLLDMIKDRETQRQVVNNTKSAQLSAEILALHQRLGRCRQAISKIEREISQQTKY